MTDLPDPRASRPSSALRPLETDRPHKVADNDNDHPPALPNRVAVPMPLPDHDHRQAASRR